MAAASDMDISSLTILTPFKTVQEPETIEEEWYLIVPSSPSAKTNAFSHAKLNDLTRKVHKGSAVGWGRYADVFIGTWETHTTSIKVAIKEIRPHIYNKDRAGSEKGLKREMRIWGNLRHPNIVLLYGIATRPGGRHAMICQWMDQGTLAEYLVEKPDLDIPSRLNLCINIAQGLSYLHSQNVIHGDLSPTNVMMDNDIAHLSDFGLSNVVADLQGQSFFTSKIGGGARWIAPELVRPAYHDGVEIKPELTTACDVYSFASVAFYTITGIIPYRKRTDDSIIAEIVMSTGSSKSPPRPTKSLLTDECWELLKLCWALDPARRPTISEVVDCLLQL